MSVVKSSSSFLFHTDLGHIVVEMSEVDEYDVEDIISDRAYSQAMAIKLLNIGKNANVNAAQGPRTMKSIYTKSKVRI